MEGFFTALLIKVLFLKPVLIALGILWVLLVTCFIFFLVYAAYHQAKLAGREIPIFSKVLIGPVMPLAGLLDVVFLNYIFGTIVFLQLPKPDEKTFAAHTFTRRLQQLVGEFSWRGIIARFFARQLDWADPKHVIRRADGQS